MADISDADIDALLAEMNKTADEAAGGGSAPASSATASAGSSGSGPAEQSEIDALLAQATFDDAPGHGGGAHGGGGGAMPSMAAPGTMPLDLPQLQKAMADAQVSSIDLLRDVELNVKIELGRSRMMVEDVLRLGEGSVVELDKLAGDPVDVYVNERLVARGEVLVLNDSFCVRVNEIVAPVRDDA
jgi:flagellar motor switch protein FliN